MIHCTFWGLFATIVLTTLLALSQGFGLTRMNVPYLLGTMFTPNRDRAKVYGLLAHLVLGTAMAWLYLLSFGLWGGAALWKGVLLGVVHGTFLLTCGVSLLPGIHPRMASTEQGPTEIRQLEPPGFLGRHYGWNTPISLLVGHMIFGAILGASLP